MFKEAKVSILCHVLLLAVLVLLLAVSLPTNNNNNSVDFSHGYAKHQSEIGLLHVFELCFLGVAIGMAIFYLMLSIGEDVFLLGCILKKGTLVINKKGKIVKILSLNEWQWRTTQNYPNCILKSALDKSASFLICHQVAGGRSQALVWKYYVEIQTPTTLEGIRKLQDRIGEAVFNWSAAVEKVIIDLLFANLAVLDRKAARAYSKESDTSEFTVKAEGLIKAELESMGITIGKSWLCDRSK